MRIDAMATMLQLPRLPSLIDAVDARVRSALHSDNSALVEATARVATAGGKRLRPVFTMAVGALGDSFDADRAVAGGAAIELVQVGSLVHDDLFEQAATRRQVPTINAVEGDNTALLSGDFILARAAEQATMVNQHFAAELARTVITLCEGQLAEMREQHNVDRPIDSYFASIRGKTAVLFAAACLAGAHCGGLDADATAAVAQFGEDFGMAFQLIDDVLDLVADPLRLMKPVGIDMETGVYTYPVLLAMSRGDEREHEHLRRLLKRRTADDLLLARELVIRAGTIDDTIAVANRHADAAAATLRGFDHPTARGLAAFPRAYLGWALEHFTAGRMVLGDAS